MPNTRFIYALIAFSVGTAKFESSANCSSEENSLIVTPFLNPNELAFDIPTSPPNVIAPVPYQH